jgi:hypothetical protein
MEIFYDSKRPEMPITFKRVQENNIVNVFRYAEGQKPIVSPLKNLSSFTGKLANKVVMSIDLCGSFFRDRSLIMDYSGDINETVQNLRRLHTEEDTGLAVRQPSKEKYMKDHAEFLSPLFQSIGIIPFGRLMEDLTMAAFTKRAGMSQFTKTFRDERARIMGNENTVSKLVKCKYNVKKDYVDFFWKSKSTDKYKSGHVVKVVDPKAGFALRAKSDKLYTIQLRILDFKKWMGTYNVDYPIKYKDVKDILEVANIQVFSDSPSFQFQGLNYNMSQLNASIHPTDIPPTSRITTTGREIGWKTRQGTDGFTDKHMTGIFSQWQFWIWPQAAMLNKELRDKGII